MIDSIEPIKLCGDSPSLSYFDNIGLCFNEQGGLEINLDKLPETYRNNIKNKILNLREWLTNVEEKDNNLIINIKSKEL